ncbi:hypothetical protein [Salmonella enterica]|uniref:hypothetical protein n=1 Tax=Salmonella enterica TaxID=28901 RepID=UPI0039B5D96E
MPVGKGTKQVETSGSRTRLNLMGVVNLCDISKTVVCEYGSITSLNMARSGVYWVYTRHTSSGMYVGCAHSPQSLTTVSDWGFAPFLQLELFRVYNS